MTLLQLIAHLKEVFEEHGDLTPALRRSDGFESYDGDIDMEDIKVNPEAKTITFT